ncbi:MAG: GldG family protein [Anaerolineales bacterium]|nr:GldG family protein [Anaerolineales bacterium]
MTAHKSSKRKQKSGPKYGMIGLGISAASLVLLFGAAAMKALEAMSLYIPTDLTLLPRLLWIGGGGILIGLAVFAASNQGRAFLRGRQAKYGGNALIASIAFLVAIVMINVIAYQNPKEWDWTQDKQNTLAPKTIEVLQSLPEPVTATAFFSGNYNSESARELLEKFRVNSKGRFDYEFIDPDKNPLAAQEAGITGDGKILLEMGGNREIAATATENEITSGFIRLLNPEQSVVYFLAGEGEHSIEEAGDLSYAALRETLEGRNYVVNALNLEAQKIPADAQVIVVGGPIAPLSSQAVEALKTYVGSGGSLIVLQDPLAVVEFGDKPDLLASYLSESWGITLNHDVVIDAQSPTGIYNATAYQYNRHPITEKMGGIGATFPFARSLSLSTGFEGVTATDLIYTTEQAWGETDPSSIEAGQPAYDPKTEIVGPMLLAVAAENTTTKGRVVVIGNSTFAVNGNFDFAGNGDLLVNSVDWAAQKDELINLDTADPIARTFKAPASALRANIMLIGSVCLIPLAIIGLGIASWYTRRKMG